MAEVQYSQIKSKLLELIASLVDKSDIPAKSAADREAHALSRSMAAASIRSTGDQHGRGRRCWPVLSKAMREECDGGAQRRCCSVISLNLILIGTRKNRKEVPPAVRSGSIGRFLC